jgi:hypothetical protein
LKIPRSVANTFFIGSSLGGYLSLVAEPHRIMHARRCVNIFHPLDPLAQRLEPWISPDIWTETHMAVAPEKQSFPLQIVPPPVSASAYLEHNMGHVSQRFVFAIFLWSLSCAKMFYSGFYRV